MNKYVVQILVTIIIVIGFGFSSCDEAPANADKLNQIPDQFVYEEETHELGWGHILDYEDKTDGLHYIDFDLYQQEEDFFGSDSVKSAYSIWFFARTGGKDATPEEGSYTFNQESIYPGFITNAYLIFWENGQLSSDQDIIPITSGELEITKKDEVYLLEFELTTEDDKNITGSYSAEIDTYKVSDFIRQKRALIEQINKNSD